MSIIERAPEVLPGIGSPSGASCSAASAVAGAGAIGDEVAEVCSLHQGLERGNQHLPTHRGVG